MVRVYKRSPDSRSYKKYSEEMLEAAVSDVTNGVCTLGQAMNKYQIPMTTIRNKIKGNHSKKHGGQPYFTEEEEKLIENRLLTFSGQSLNMSDLCNIAQTYLNEMNRNVPKFTNNLPGIDWAKGFVKRRGLAHLFKTSTRTKSIPEVVDDKVLKLVSGKPISNENEEKQNNIEIQNETSFKIKEEPVSDNDDDPEQCSQLQPISEVYLQEYQDVNIKTEVEDPIDSTYTFKTESSNNEEEIEIKSEITAEEVDWASLDANEKNCVDSESLVLAHENNTTNQVQAVRIENKPAANISPLFCCHVCFQIFLDDSVLKQHLIVCHNLIKIDKNSKDCPQQSNTPSQLPKKVFSLKKLHKCDVCNKTFRWKYRLAQHKLVHSEPQMQCPHCDKKLRESFSLKRHIDTEHNGGAHKCDQCDKKFKTKHCLHKHKKLMHSAFNGNPWICDECGRGFKCKMYLNRHKTRTHCNAKYSCDQCGKEFKQKDNFKRHIKGHDSGSVCNFKCDLCAFIFKCKSSLLRHFRRVHLPPI